MNSKRLSAPDTQADKDLKALLSGAPVQSFLMVAGAGSGKTTSLVKALVHLVETRGKELRRGGQQIACITYTEIAAAEIWNEVGNNSMFHVSTIHSFFWALVKPYQSDIKVWVKGRIEEKIVETRQKISNFGPRVQQRTRDNARVDLEGLQRDLAKIDGVDDEFRYGTGSDYEAGILGHDDVINIVPELLAKHPLLRQLVAKKYPYIFVDECQDTMPVVVDALKALAGTIEKWPCIGFFGDPMQRIFLSGAPTITVPDTWKTITKPENFRCPTSVLKVINRIRLEDDGLQQTRGRHETIEGQSVPVVGAAHLFVVPADGQRRERMKAIRRWMSQTYKDPLWESDNEDDVKMLVIVHRMAATRLGFANLFNAFNDFGGSSLKDGFTEGAAWALTPLRSYLVPLVVAANEKRQFDVISLLRENSPLLERSGLKPDAEIAKYLDSLQKSLVKLQSYFAEGSSNTVRDVLVLARDEKLGELDQRILDHLRQGLTDDDSDNDARIMRAFLASPAFELLPYQAYIERLSPFATQQGIKGAEFERVLTVVDDEESTHFLFSYNKYFGITPLSAGDHKNIEEGRETVVDRTRRLFYVCCSRAERHLAVAVFVPDVNAAIAAIMGRGLFEVAQVVQLADLEALAST